MALVLALVQAIHNALILTLFVISQINHAACVQRIANVLMVKFVISLAPVLALVQVMHNALTLTLFVISLINHAVCARQIANVLTA